ncbi:MAG: cell division protein FtsA [Lactococcus sp.]|uniref:Cell division protein FtsA n=1 Tax=Pseudolactococcus piscium MKFS47 TaxID=297352 RepID=A0A0D6DYE1_9LACT|nr:MULTISPECIES: cell division protein FtsA [Lactococcus]MBR6896507.1 cell division protein FtsA [Lactococcus sp.]MCJ1970336.1 cell division protein FtsA [Lactococcus carnosus]MDN5403585.1 cell division protein FtsA [Lactococcus sp.]MDN5409728.1 cell division protein FtsA [Lactococcus sp.]MDN5411680.1 cell division protein FtsA [Lactococcus sp.]
MAKSGLYTGLDIGTSTIKVLVAEYVSGEMNIIGVGNAKSDGLKNGTIVDIEKVSQAIRKAVNAAEERAGIQIKGLNVAVPANRLEVDACQGMVTINSESKEVVESDISQVVSSALMRGMMPEREIIAVEPKEFTVDGFSGISDPRGMFGVRLEMKGLVYTGPKTLVHNIRRAVERAGLIVDNIVIAPLAIAHHVLTEGEREFGTVVIDLGAGQTTVLAIRDQELQFAHIIPEGGDYITKDISTVLNTSLDQADSLKLNYGEASTARASQEEKFPVSVVGHMEPLEITEYYLSEIVEARLTQIFSRVRQDLERSRGLNLPGGIVLLGGAAAMPGVAELATEIIGANVRLYVPNEMGLRNPTFAQVISIVDYVGSRSEIENLVTLAAAGNAVFSEPVVDTHAMYREPVVSFSENNFVQTADETSYAVPVSQSNVPKQTKEPKEGLVDKVRNLFGSMFD